MILECSNEAIVASFVVNDRIVKSLRAKCRKRKTGHVWGSPNLEPLLTVDKATGEFSLPNPRKRDPSKDKIIRWCRRCGTATTQAEIELRAVIRP